MSNQSVDRSKAEDRRHHCRFPLNAPARLEREDGGTPITVQSDNISWGGACFVLPKHALPQAKSVKMILPWAQGSEFSATAEIVRSEALDDQRCRVAARFSSISTSDQHHLYKLLQVLQNAAGGEARLQAQLAPTLEVLFNDGNEIRAKLAELVAGRLSLTVFKHYEPDQSIRLIIGGLTDQRALRLRARVAEISRLSNAKELPWPIFDVNLHFEHPLDELKAAAVVAFGMARLVEPNHRPQDGRAAPESVRRTASAS